MKYLKYFENNNINPFQEEGWDEKNKIKEKQKEISDALEYLGKDCYKISEINKAKILKYLTGRNDIGRYYGIEHFNKRNGSWIGQIWGDELKDVFKYYPPDIIYDRKLNVSYEYLLSNQEFTMTSNGPIF